jgi:NADPH-dependent 2,4-dienoyl-CoA reductase/sulfur reductase-like enzyme
MAGAEPEREPERVADATARIGPTAATSISRPGGMRWPPMSRPTMTIERTRPANSHRWSEDDRIPYRVGFDHLVLATGAVPVRPPLPGCDAAGVFGVQILDDGAALLAGLERLWPQRAVVIGGDIGVEMAEALARRHVAVTVVDQAPQPMSTLDPDMDELVHQAMEKLGIGGHTDAVVLGLGVRPNTALATRPGCPWATTAASAPPCAPAPGRRISRAPSA